MKTGEPGKVLEGKPRDAAIKEHLEWLDGRLPSEALEAEKNQRLLSIAVWDATRRNNSRRRKRR